MSILTLAGIAVVVVRVSVYARGEDPLSPMQIALAMAVTASGASAAFDRDKQSLKLMLPYLPLASHLKQVCQYLFVLSH